LRPPEIVAIPVILILVAVIDANVEIPLKFADTPVSDVRVLIPGALIPVTIPARITLPALMLPSVENPVTFNVVCWTNPRVLIPGTFRPVTIPASATLPALTAARVENPVTLKSVKVFGALTIAASIVAVVVASREAMFCSCLPELMTCVASMFRELVVVIPDALMLVALMFAIVPIPL